MENVDKNAIVDSDDGHVEVDSVISEADATLTLAIEAPNETVAQEQLRLILAQAQSQSPGVTSTSHWHKGRLDASLVFPTAAERLTFEMGLR
ncbi:DUF406 family protein [Marinobacter hydrocarbonoclasticus]|nr:DUF406 family protein [Marinobacter nauticus]